MNDIQFRSDFGLVTVAGFFMALDKSESSQSVKLVQVVSFRVLVHFFFSSVEKACVCFYVQL